MKFVILLEMLFDLLAKRKVTASYFAEKFEISTRTVYRYIDLLSTCVPVYVKQGRDGGILISDSYKLPKGFMTEEEYQATVEALETMYAQLPEERFLTAKRKLSAQAKSELRDLALSGEVGGILVDGGTWGDSRSFSEKLRLMEECIKEKAVLEIVYHARTGEKSQRKIEPHVLVFKQNIWYLYAFCHNQRAFRLFRVGRIFSAVKMDEFFQKRPFNREDIPLNFWTDGVETVKLRLKIAESSFADAQDWLGGENLRRQNGEWYAEVELPDEEGLVLKILSLGAGVKVLAPEDLKDRVQKVAQQIYKAYER